MPVWSSHLVKKYWAMRLENLKSAGKSVFAFTLLALVLAGCQLDSSYNYPRSDYSYQYNSYRYGNPGHYRYYRHYGRRSHYGYRYR